jgi:hypothetical protein
MHARRFAAGALVTTAACVAALVGTATPPVSAATITATPVADTYVASNTPGTNFGRRGNYWVDSSPNRRILMKFNISGLTGPVTSARLRMHVDDVTGAESSSGGTYRLMSNASWTETGATWYSQPAIDGVTLGSIGAVARNTWVELDVTGKITGNGTYSIGVTTTSSNGAAFDSRESGSFAPQLVFVTGTQPPPGDPVLVGAGDIANSSTGDSATAALLDNIPGTVFTAGDNAYPNGTLADYNTYYGPTWGRHKARTRPSPGNHEYNTAGAAGYFAYFGGLAGPSGRGYYSYDLGEWHVVSLNSEVSMVAGSAQETWLRTDLAASAKPCTLAYWHKPLFTSSAHPGETATRPLFQALYDYDAEVVVAGHNHTYERFAPMNPQGALDTTAGVRSFVAGMGGASHYAFNSTPRPNSQVRNGTAYGVLKFTLHSDSYEWQFVPVAGQSFTDSGTNACH